MNRSFTFFACVSLAMITSSAEAELIVNGSFETGDATGWTTSNLQSAFSGVEVSGFQGVPAPDGSYFASVSNESPSGAAEFSQTVSTVNGQAYHLTFLLYTSGVERPTAPVIDFKVKWDNLTLVDTPPATAPFFTHYSFDVLGTGSDTLSFSGINDPGFNFFDDVHLNASEAPLPGNLTMCGIGAAMGLCLCCYRRRHAAPA